MVLPEEVLTLVIWKIYLAILAIFSAILDLVVLEVVLVVVVREVNE